MEEFIDDVGDLGEEGSSMYRLICLLTFLNPGLVGSQDCVVSFVPLDAVGMCGYLRAIGTGYFLLKLPECGRCPLPSALPGSPETVRGTGPSIEGPQLSKEKGCAALRYGPRAL